MNRFIGANREKCNKFFAKNFKPVYEEPSHVRLIKKKNGKVVGADAKQKKKFFRKVVTNHVVEQDANLRFIEFHTFFPKEVIREVEQARITENGKIYVFTYLEDQYGKVQDTEWNEFEMAQVISDDQLMTTEVER